MNANVGSSPRIPHPATRPRLAPLWREALAPLESIALRLSPVWRGEGMSQGHGEPVVLVPGFLADDSTLVLLHAWLQRLGYRPYLSGIGRVNRCPNRLAEALLARIDTACEESGQRVHLIGHSLGGVIARGAALRHPGSVAQVITLGSPLRGVSAHPLLVAIAEWIRGDCDGLCIGRMQAALPGAIDEVNVFTRTDAVVDWTTCTSGSAGCRIEVAASHCGLIANHGAYAAIASALARSPTAMRATSRVVALASAPLARRHTRALAA